MPLPIFLKPDGSSEESRFHKEVHRVVSEMTRISPTPGSNHNNTTRGMSVYLEESRPAQVSLSMYKLRDVQDDYLIAHSWDGTNEGTTDVYIAKEPRHRTSITAETIRGTDHAFTYDDGPSEDWDIETGTRFNKTRHDDDGTIEDQCIVPSWIDGEVIYAKPARTDVTRPRSDEDSTAIPVTLLIDGRSCQWAVKSS